MCLVSGALLDGLQLLIPVVHAVNEHDDSRLIFAACKLFTESEVVAVQVGGCQKLGFLFYLVVQLEEALNFFIGSQLDQRMKQFVDKLHERCDIVRAAELIILMIIVDVDVG